MTVKPGSYEWHERISALFDAAGSALFSTELHRAISAVLPLQSFIVFHYRAAAIPEILYENLGHTNRENNLENYLKGAYLLDPFYQYFFEDNEPGVVSLKDVAPDHFIKSEYYGTYYKFSSLTDEVNVFVRLADKSFIVLALGRLLGERRFSKQDIQRLQDFQPVLGSVCLRQWVGQENKGNVRFIKGLENFGTSCLSTKESEALHLLLRGHSIKSTALRMNISPGTVKTHRNNLYAKLDINSQTELFSLFIGALAHMKGDGSEDPLVAYHQKMPDA